MIARQLLHRDQGRGEGNKYILFELNFLLCPIPSMIAYLSTLIDDRNVINTRFFVRVTSTDSWGSLFFVEMIFFNVELRSYMDISSKNCLLFFLFFFQRLSSPSPCKNF